MACLCHIRCPGFLNPTYEMPNVASVLKSEMSRVARKEVRGETLSLKKALSAYRTEIAALKRRALSLEHAVRRLSSVHLKPAPTGAIDQDVGKFRFSAKGLASQRRRLGLSAGQCGLLLGASAQSIYNWERGKTRTLVRHLPAIAAVRGMSKKDVTTRLQSLQRQ